MPQNPHMPRGYGPNSYVGPCRGKHIVGFTCLWCERNGLAKQDHEPTGRDEHGNIMPKRPESAEGVSYDSRKADSL